MDVPLLLVDAFASLPFEGNPAGVCLLDVPADDGWMQGLASEMNQSETAFLFPVDEGYKLRWFTPAEEVDLCGHATLASAHALWETGRLPKDRPARFHTKSGELVCVKKEDRIEMDFPAEPAREMAVEPDLLSALGAEAKWTGRNRMDILVEVLDESVVRALKPDLAKLAQIETRGVIVTSRSQDPSVDFVSRLFAPAIGIPEDPVTGSSHCCLGPYWAEKLNKTELSAYQASRRGGRMGVIVRGERVTLIGSAVTTVRGEVWVHS